MKVLVLGGAGMLGHCVYRYLRRYHTVGVTLRGSLDYYEPFDLFASDNTYDKIDVREFKQVEKVVAAFRPEAIINCVGITNKGDVAGDTILNIEVNALFPHRLAKLCTEQQIRLIHISTDCVFSGLKGNYNEQDMADAVDLYGRSKLLGEVNNDCSLTLRTSIIGLGLEKRKGLLEWFLSQKDTIHGYANAIFSGFTTHEFARIIEKVLLSEKWVTGPMHVSSKSISKYDLLNRLKAALQLPIQIIPDKEFKCDRSLHSRLFQETFGYTPPSWSTMLKELCEQIKSERL